MVPRRIAVVLYNSERGAYGSKKGGGSTRNGRDSATKRLGVKRFAGLTVKSGTIIVATRGTKIHPAITWAKAG